MHIKATSGKLYLVFALIKYFILVILFYFIPFSLAYSFAPFSSFYRNLPENRREEITIIDAYTVKVGLGPDRQSVSCTILDAVGSLPSLDGSTEPDVVYVNNERVHHIREGLYTWDSSGKYRVRLTTKYIRQFGDIFVRVPDPSAPKPAIEKLKTSENPSSFYQSLPKNKQEEIAIIDAYMVEVGLGPDLRSVSSQIQDAIQSIPAVGEGNFPESVNVNGKPIFFIGNGLYSWDTDGSNPVRLSTTYIKNFGNIRISIPGEPPSPTTQETSVVVLEKKTPAAFPAKKITDGGEKKVDKASSTKHSATPEGTGILKEEFMAKVSRKTQAINGEKPAPSPGTEREKALGLNGFRLARFGMGIPQVKKAIQDDFNIDESLIMLTGQEKNIIAISTNKLSAIGEIASIQYLFTIKEKRLIQIHVLWKPSKNTNKIATKLAQKFFNSRFLKNQSSAGGDYLYFGKDFYGNELKLSWMNAPKGDLSNERSLLLSYLALIDKDGHISLQNQTHGKGK